MATMNISNNADPAVKSVDRRKKIAKSNSIPKDQIPDLTKHFGNVIGGSIFSHMD